MAKLPTPQESATRLLKLCVVRFHHRPGDIVNARGLWKAWHTDGWRQSDFIVAVDYCEQVKWIVNDKLTPEGFKEA